MSRSGYSDDCDEWALIRWRGAVTAAINGRRGQAFLHDLVVALDALPHKRLIAGQLEQKGEVCAIGSVGRMRGLNMRGLDPDNPSMVATKFGIAPALVAEISYENDEDFARLTVIPEQRWSRMRQWTVEHIRHDKKVKTHDASEDR